MKQKIVIQMPMHCDKCRGKALKIASVAKGTVNSVAIEGNDRDRLVVTGEGVDSVCLAKVLRKKFKVHTTIISVEEVKEKKKEDEKKPPELHWCPCPYPPYVVCEPYRDGTYCTVM